MAIHGGLFVTIIVLLWASGTSAARWENRVMEHGVAVDVSRRIGGDHVLRNDLFSTLNRRRLASCANLFPYAKIQVDAAGPLADVQTITVTVSGMTNPGVDRDWVAVMSPSNSNTDACPGSGALYLQTGDTSSNPLTCHYPIKGCAGSCPGAMHWNF